MVHAIVNGRHYDIPEAWLMGSATRALIDGGANPVDEYMRALRAWDEQAQMQEEWEREHA